MLYNIFILHRNTNYKNMKAKISVKWKERLHDRCILRRKHQGLYYPHFVETKACKLKMQLILIDIRRYLKRINNI